MPALLRSIADSRVLKWIDEFIEDKDEGIQVRGLSIVTQLLISGWINFKDCEDLLLKAEKHSNSAVREEAQFIREIKL